MPQLNKDHKTYEHAYNYFSGMPWAILKSKLAEIKMFMARKMAGEEIPADFRVADYAAAHALDAKGRPASTTGGSVAVIPLMGTISKRADLMTEISGGSSIDSFTKAFREAVANSSVKAIVINIDSPGGSVFGVQELADEIMAARDTKHIVGVANDMAASAAYWLAAACDELVVTPSGMVGSIGVYTMHQDYSKQMEAEGVDTTFIQAGKYKTEGNPYAPLDDEARADLQKSVDFYYDSFVKAVAKGRGITVGKVNSDFGQGRMFNSVDAKALGMVDRVDTLDGVLSRLGVGGNAPSKTRSEERRISHALAEQEIALSEK